MAIIQCACGCGKLLESSLKGIYVDKIIKNGKIVYQRKFINEEHYLKYRGKNAAKKGVEYDKIYVDIYNIVAGLIGAKSDAKALMQNSYDNWTKDIQPSEILNYFIGNKPRLESEMRKFFYAKRAESVSLDRAIGRLNYIIKKDIENLKSENEEEEKIIQTERIAEENKNAGQKKNKRLSLAELEDEE